MPDTAVTSLVQKETDSYYSAVTKVEFNATDTATKAGLYLSNGNQKVFASLYSSFNNGKLIVFKFDTAVRSMPNSFGNTVWLKVERNKHLLSGWCSADGNKWVSLGASISVINLDKVQPNYNSWVGTSVGIFTEGRPADFDWFVCKDGFSLMPVAGFSNYYGVEKITGNDMEEIVTPGTVHGGWLMIAGVDLGNRTARRIELQAKTTKKANIEIWLDDLKNGKLIATIPVAATSGENEWKAFSSAVKDVSGHHDVFIKFPPGTNQELFIKTIRFLK